MSKYFAILSGELTYLGEFKSYFEAEEYAEGMGDGGIAPEVDWLIDENEANKWLTLLGDNL